MDEGEVRRIKAKGAAAEEENQLGAPRSAVTNEGCSRRRRQRVLVQEEKLPQFIKAGGRED